MAPQFSESQVAVSLVNYRETRDFDEQADWLREWNQDYLQISSGHFNGYVSEIRFGDVHLFLEYTSQALFQRGQLADDVIAVGVPLAAQTPGVFCGSTSKSDCMHVFSGRNGFEFFSPSGLVMAGISIGRADLLDMLTPDEQETVQTGSKQAHVFALDSSGLEAIRCFMSKAFQAVSATPEMLQNRQITQSLRNSLLSLLADNMVHTTETASISLSAARCWKIVAESREMVLEQTESPLSVADLCKHFGVSRRTLQYCFQNLLATSPAAYLRAERLNAVRRMLREREANSVTEAAASWGFWHFGHFSQEYKKMFGELPSVTYKRAHSLN